MYNIDTYPHGCTPYMYILVILTTLLIVKFFDDNIVFVPQKAVRD